MIVFCSNAFDDNVRSQFPEAMVGVDSGDISTSGDGSYGTTREQGTVQMRRGVKQLKGCNKGMKQDLPLKSVLSGRNKTCHQLPVLC